MNTKFFHIIKCSIVFSMLLALGACATGSGIPTGQAQILIRGHSLNEIQTKSEDVFYRHGFAMHGMSADEMRFERRGGTTDNLLYGNWNENTTYTKITLFISPAGEDTYRLRLRSEVIRDTFGGDSNAKMFDIQGSRYGGILKKIRQELE